MNIDPIRIVERLPRVEPRERWRAGPWNEEPDLIEWRDAVTGYPCLIVRNDFGALCGYVGLPPEHPLHGKDYDDANVDVHGGLTYANACGGDICHMPRTGESDDVWWLGFDCAHSGDLVPGLTMLAGTAGFKERAWETYKNVDYVEERVTSLAEQLKALANPPLPPPPGAREDE